MRSCTEMSREHLDGICLIEQESFKDPWSRKAYEDEIENPMAVYRVLTENDEVVGYGGFWQIFDEAHITNVAVGRKFRNQGAGSMIMEALIAEAKKRNLCAMTLEVRVSNESAIALYKKFGFASAGVRPRYYGDGEDALIMWLEGIC